MKIFYGEKRQIYLPKTTKQNQQIQTWRSQQPKTENDVNTVIVYPRKRRNSNYIKIRRVYYAEEIFIPQHSTKKHEQTKTKDYLAIVIFLLFLILLISLLKL